MPHRRWRRGGWEGGWISHGWHAAERVGKERERLAIILARLSNKAINCRRSSRRRGRRERGREKERERERERERAKEREGERERDVKGILKFALTLLLRHSKSGRFRHHRSCWNYPWGIRASGLTRQNTAKTFEGDNTDNIKVEEKTTHIKNGLKKYPSSHTHLKHKKLTVQHECEEENVNGRATFRDIQLPLQLGPFRLREETETL